MYLLIISLLIFSHSTFAKYDIQYVFPEVKIEVYSPRGFSVSIPDSEGVQLFAFHGNLNKPLVNFEKGELRKDITEVTNGRWIYQNDNVALRQGDELHYWLFVIKDDLGFRMDNQVYKVEKRPTKTRPRPTSKPQTTTTMKAFENFGDTPYELPSELTPFSESSENPELIRPEKNRAKDCDCRQICEKINLEKEEPISPTDSPVQISKALQTVGHIRAESLQKVTEENKILKERLEILFDLSQHMIQVVEQEAESAKLKKVKLSGRFPSGDDYERFVNTLFKDKLFVNFYPRSVEKIGDYLVIEMDNYGRKLEVLLAAQEKLSKSNMHITDVMLDD